MYEEVLCRSIVAFCSPFRPLGGWRVPVPVDVGKRIEENLRLVESGELSYAKLAERHGVSKSTVYRMQKAEEAGG